MFSPGGHAGTCRRVATPAKHATPRILQLHLGPALRSVGHWGCICDTQRHQTSGRSLLEPRDEYPSIFADQPGGFNHFSSRHAISPPGRAPTELLTAPLPGMNTKTARGMSPTWGKVAYLGVLRSAYPQRVSGTFAERLPPGALTIPSPPTSQPPAGSQHPCAARDGLKICRL